jgi:hypothetical protein
MWSGFRVVMVVLAIFTAFTFMIILSAITSGIPLIYAELTAFLYYFGIGMAISSKNKR